MELFIELVGFTASGVLKIRWIMEIIESRKPKSKGLSVLPKGFWVFTLIGSLLWVYYGFLIGSFAVPIDAGLGVVYSVYKLNTLTNNKGI